MNILGISAFYHDSAAALLCDGEIVAAAQEERFSRKKHDPCFPQQAAAYCLREAGLDSSSLNCVVFYDKPFLKFERLLMTFLGTAPRGLQAFYQQMPVWLREKLFTRNLLRKSLSYDGEILFATHHLSHAASAFYPSPYEEAAILTVDGVGEWATTALAAGRGKNIEILREIRFPHSLGLLYSAFTYYCGFKVNSGEYKLMGLAPYGEPVYADLIQQELIDLRQDGSFRLNMAYFDYCGGMRMTNRRFDRLFGGPPRQPEAEITEREMNLAASIQSVTETALMNMARHAHHVTGLKNLCIGGGVGLNCVANGKILREGPFDDLWIQPCAGDGGSALGAALLAWHQVHGQPRSPHPRRQRATYLGPAFSDESIRDWLDREGIPHQCLEESQRGNAVAEKIAEGNVVGWFQGRMEFGPRALGARSILGDPRSRDMQSVLNLKIKFRESFRPFAPSVLREHADKYFDLRGKESPYMLLVAQLKEAHRLPLEDSDRKARGFAKLRTARSTLPAITHVDYSARVHTVEREDHPRYHELLQAFYALTGCPVLINTSFNVRGEPIVHTPEEAYACFMRTDMDFLCLGNCLLDKKDQPPWSGDESWRAGLELD